MDATLVGAHSEKEHAAPSFKRGFGFHPMLASVYHAEGGTGEPVAALLRPCNANANNAADQIAVLDAARAQLPDQVRSRVLVRGDVRVGHYVLLDPRSRTGLQFTVGMNIRGAILDAFDRCRTRRGGTPSIPMVRPETEPRLAYELLTWTQTLAWRDQSARVWEPSDCAYVCSPSPAG